MSDSDKSNSNNVLIHLHVPKCAGTSLTTVIRHKFEQRALLYVDVQAWEYRVQSLTEARENGQPYDVDGLKIAQDRLSNWHTYLNATHAYRDANYDAIYGHLHWGHHENFRRKTTYISIIRPVIDRIVSFFNFLHVQPTNPSHAILNANLPNLNELTPEFFERHPQYIYMWSNYFCRAYSGRAVVDEADYKSLEKSVLLAMDEGRFVCGSIKRIENYLKTTSLFDAPLPIVNVTDTASNEKFEPAKTTDLLPGVIEQLSNINNFDLRLIDAIQTHEARHSF